jgi:hypothetical protein
MATSGNSTLRAFNSLGGFSVKDDPQIVIIDANGNVTTNVLVVNNSANLGNVGNVHIYGGSEGQVLQTDGNGNLTWSSSANVNQIHNGNSNVTIPDVNGNVYINANSGVDRQWNFDTTGNTTFPAIGVVSLGNLATANYVNVTTQINGNIANFTGNLTAANANLGNLLTVNYANITNDINVSSGNITLTTGYANIGGNLTAANAALGNLVTANYVNVSSNLQTSNLGITGNITGNLIPAANVTYNLGNATNAWKDLYLSGTTIYIGSQNISSNATAISVSNDFAANSFFATNNVTANGNVYANAGGGKGYIYANFANVESNLYVGANANIVNTLTAANIKDTNLSNTQIVYANASNTLTGSANFVFNDSTNTLIVTGNANVTNTINGNIANFSGNLTALNANLGNLATANYVNAATITANTKVDFYTGNANVQLGNVGNVHIYGGSNGQVLQTDGAGNLTWSSTANINEIQNGNSNVMIATANGNVTITAGGLYTWTFNASNGLLTAPGDIQTNGTINANAILSATDITSTGGNLNANTGTVNANTANISGNLSANNANITNTLTANVANITTMNVANISTTGNITANGLTVNLDASMNTANFSGQVYINNSANVTGNLGVGGNITTTGAGGNITMSGGNINGVNYLFANAANITNLLQGNTANFTGNVTAANFIGTFANGGSNVIIANSGNISFSVSPLANVVTFSNVGIDTIGYVTANGNITSNTGFVSNTVTAFANTPLTLNAGTASGAANINVVLVPSGNGTVDVSGKRITSVATPTGDTDAANKAYVDSVAQGLNIKASVYAATYAALPSYTYNNGTAGVGATITANAFGALVVDGQTISTVGTRVLVKNETAGNAPYNGIYTLTTAGDGSTAFVLTRSLDMNVATEFDGAFTFISVGTHNADTGWVQTGEIVTVGTTPVVWTQFSGAGQYTANTAAGLVLNGTVFSAKVDGNTNPTTAFDGNGNIYVPAGAAFTTPNIGAATGTSINLTGNVLANNLNANTLITTVNLDATGNIRTGNITANVDITATANLSANNANITNNITVGSANVTGNLQGNIANFTGNLTAANANLGNLATANYVNVATQINGNIANFSGNLTAANANLGNLVTANYANIANELVVSGNANVTSNVNVTANVTANNITSNNRVTATNIKIGNSYIYANTVTTLTTTPTEICSFMITNTDVYGIEYIVKSFDSTTGASKYSMATVQAVTNGLDVDYTTFATVRLGNTTGQLSVTRSAVGSDVSINLIATPASSNSTTWTTQYRLI